MAQFPGLMIWTDALIADTEHLGNPEFAAYVRMILIASRMPDCKLPDDDKFLARITHAGRNWRKIKPVVMAFWQKDADGKWYQKRLLRERERVLHKSSLAARAGRASALKRKGLGSTDVQQTLQQNGQQNVNHHIHTNTKIDSESGISTEYVPESSSPTHTGADAKKMWAEDEVRAAFDYCLAQCKDQQQHGRMILDWLRAGATPALIREIVEITLKSARLSPRYGENFKPDTFAFFDKAIRREIENRKSEIKSETVPQKSPEDIFEMGIRSLAKACQQNRRVEGNWQSWITPGAIRTAYERKLIHLDWMWISGVRMEPEVTIYEQAVKSWRVQFSHKPDAPNETVWVAEAVTRALAERESKQAPVLH